MIENITNEIWYDIPGYVGYYQLSNLHNAKSLDRWIIYSNGVKHFCKGQLLKPFLSDGYLTVGLSKNGNPKTFNIHHLIGLVFIPNPNNYTHVLHIDNNTTHNDISNLKWGTDRQNIQEAWRDGLHKKTIEVSSEYHSQKQFGEANPFGHKLTVDKVLEIRQKKLTGQYTNKQLGAEYNVSAQIIGNVIRRKDWKHVK